MPLQFLTAENEQSRTPGRGAVAASSAAGPAAAVERENLGWLSRPDVRAGLLQLGVSLLSGANLGQGLGEGFAAAGRYNTTLRDRERQNTEDDREMELHNLKLLEAQQRVDASKASTRQADRRLDLTERDLDLRTEQDLYNRNLRERTQDLTAQRLEADIERTKAEMRAATVQADQAAQRLELDRERHVDDRQYRDRDFELRRAQLDARTAQSRLSALSEAKNNLSEQYQDIFKLVYDNYADEISNSITGDQAFAPTELARRFNDALKLRNMPGVDTLMFTPAALSMRQNGWPESLIHAYVERYSPDELGVFARMPYQQWIKDRQTEQDTGAQTQAAQSAAAADIPAAPGSNYRGGPGQMGRRNVNRPDPLSGAADTVALQEQITRLRILAARGGRTGKLARDQLRRLMERNPERLP